MGQRLLSLKGDLPFWRGKSRLSVNDRGQRRFLKLENCYVSSDGGEIRQFPGYATLVDLTAINNSEGYERLVPDGAVPILDLQSPNAPYRERFDLDPAQIGFLDCKARPSHLFAFEQVGDEIFVIGESRFREAPIYNTSRIKLTIENVDTTGGTYVVTLTGSPGGISNTNQGTAGLNGLTTEHVVYIEDVVVDDVAAQAAINTNLNGKIHQISNIASDVVTLRTTTATSFDLSATGEIHSTRYNRTDTYSTPSGTDPYDSTYDNRPDDPDALTVWRVTAKPDLSSTSVVPCWPAWVANRQRDWGDYNNVGGEGILFSPTVGYRGVSRREQRRLPYRPTVECALDRIILAAPQYGCMFQIPAIVSIDPSPWPTQGATSDLGVVYQNNSIYDKPRSLGIPKPRLIENIYTPAPTSPNDDGSVSVNVSAREGSPNYGLAEGTYRFAISFEDAGTGEEGLASEPITVVIPAAGTYPYAYTISINYIHPGYLMPECLATKMNVYIATSADGPLAHYGTFELEENPVLSLVGLGNTAGSAVYGFTRTTPEDPYALWRRFDLPLLDDSGDISNVLDATRLAPQSATMPRGATACKYIRGVLFAGGSLGNAGPSQQLWDATASIVHTDGDPYYRDDEMFINAHATNGAAIPPIGGAVVDGDSQKGTLGIAGRAFPDAYQGIEIISNQALFPGGDSFKAIDRVLNRRVATRVNLSSPSSIAYHRDVVKLQRDIYDRERVPGSSPNTSTVSKSAEQIFYVMPRGQLQVGDPGEPQRSSRAFIKIVDPNKGDDITAIGQLAGSAVICTRKETYSYSWYRNPGGEEPALMSNEFGCIAPNSMVEFDGGLAWLSERGPVAIGGGLQHVGQDIAEDFYGQGRVYKSDSRGMMYHSWGYHDAQRNLVIWGLVREDSATVIEDEGVEGISQVNATDKQLSRFPCDEMLVWSYKTGAFSTWRPPAGLEVLWMRTIRDAGGQPRACFLAADQRIYALDDTWTDANSFQASCTVTPTAAGSGTTLSFTNGGTFQDGDTGFEQRNTNLLLRVGMLVEIIDENGDVVSDTTIASVTSTGATGGTIVLTASQSWKTGYLVRIGGRQRATILSNYIGAETMDTMSIDGLQVRYTLNGNLGTAGARIRLLKSDWDAGRGEDSRTINLTDGDKFEELGWVSNTSNAIASLGRRRSFQKGRADCQEVAVQIELTGEQQVRIQDIALELGA